MDFDPLWLLVPLLMLVCAAFTVEDWRLERKIRGQIEAEQAAIERVLSGYQQADSQIWTSLNTSTKQLGTALDLHHHVDLAQADHVHTEYAALSHDHSGGEQGHVHWLKYNSTELTDSKRRDVYICLVPQCRAIFSHYPET